MDPRTLFPLLYCVVIWTWSLWPLYLNHRIVMSMELVTNYVMCIATWSWDCGGIHNGHFEFVIKFEVVTQGNAYQGPEFSSICCFLLLGNQSWPSNRKLWFLVEPLPSRCSSRSISRHEALNWNFAYRCFGVLDLVSVGTLDSKDTIVFKVLGYKIFGWNLGEVDLKNSLCVMVME
jgi:hypothetical protein